MWGERADALARAERAEAAVKRLRGLVGEWANNMPVLTPRGCCATATCAVHAILRKMREEAAQRICAEALEEERG